MRFVWLFLLGLLMVCGMWRGACARAQGNEASVSGELTDFAGKRVAGARVLARNPGTGAERDTVTNGAGEYLLLDLAAGTWQIRVQLAGRGMSKALALRVAPALRQSLDLRVGKAGASLIRTPGGSALISQFPPGVVDEGNSGQRTIRFATRMAGSSELVLDDMDMTPLISRSQNGLSRYLLVPYSYQEVRLTAAQFTADSNMTPGGQRAIVSRTGANRFHGDFFGFPRNDLLSANAGFSSSNLKLSSNQYGGAVGGPIRKDQSHFYFVYFGLRQTIGEVLTGYVPTVSFADAVKTQHPELRTLVNAYPAGTNAVAGSPDSMTFLGVGNQVDNEDAISIRLDQDLRGHAGQSGRDSIFLRMSFDSAMTSAPLSQSGTYLEDTLTRRAHPLSGVAGLTHRFSNSLTDDVRVGFARGTFESDYQGALNQPFSLVVSGLTTLSGTQSTYGASNVYSAQDSVAWVHGKHTLLSGGEARLEQLNQKNSAAGTLDYASFQAFESNQLSTAAYNQALSSNGLRELEIFGWGQENWRPRDNLQIGAGVRYQFFNRPHEVHGKAIPFDFVTCGTGGFCAAGADFNQLNVLNFDPRAEVAWTPEKGPDWMRGKVVVRAGGGIYHTNGLLSDQSQPIYNEVENYSLSSVSQAGLRYPITPFLGDTAGVASAQGMGRRRKDGYVTEWSGSLQGMLPWQLLTTATYFGAEGTHLYSNTYLNLVNPSTGARPFPAFGQVPFRENEGSSSQNSLALNVQHDLRNGIRLMAGYDWAHEIDNGASGAGEEDAPENPACPRCDRASGDGDVRQSMGLYSVYAVPYGPGREHQFGNVWLNRITEDWDVLNNFTARTGLPVNVTIDRSASQVATGYTVAQRPDRVAGVSLRPRGGQNVEDWINPAAFTTVHGLYGDSERNVARGPAAWQLDTSLRRTFPLPRKAHLRVTADIQNIFNHAQYGQPLSDWSTSQFGEIVSPSNTNRVGAGGARALFLSFDASF